MTFTRMGVKFKKAKAYPYRQGVGKVHLMYWNKGHNEWEKYCGYNNRQTAKDVPDDTEVTCSRCIVIAPKGTVKSDK